MKFSGRLALDQWTND